MYHLFVCVCVCVCVCDHPNCKSIIRVWSTTSVRSTPLPVSLNASTVESPFALKGLQTMSVSVQRDIDQYEISWPVSLPLVVFVGVHAVHGWMVCVCVCVCTCVHSSEVHDSFTKQQINVVQCTYTITYNIIIAIVI